MHETILFIATFVVGVIASTIGTLVGGGSLISIPFLIFLGLPPQMAIATDRFGGLGQLTALYKFWKSKKIIWKFVFLFSVLSLAGSLIGSHLLLQINPSILKSVIGALMLILLPVIFLKRNIGVQPSEVHGIKKILGCIIYFCVQIYAGFFGAGSGTLIFYTMMSFFGLTITEASATQIIPVTILDIASLIVFASHGLINYKIGFLFLAGTATGGYIGSHIALKKGDKWIKQLFAFIVIALVIKLLFF